MSQVFGVYNTSYAKDLAIVRTRPQWALLIAALAACVIVPTLLSGPWLTWLTTLGIYCVAVLGLHVLFGLGGMMSLGQAAFIALGAYTTAILGSTYGLPAWATLPAAALVAGLFGALFTIPAMRITGFYLVILTMAAHQVIVWALREFDGLTGGIRGMSVPALSIAGQRVGDVGICWLILGTLVIMVLLVKNLQRTNLGRQLLAMRDNSLAAEVMGINLLRLKILAFFICCSLGGVAGWLWAHSLGFVHPEQFPTLMSFKLIAMIIVGGIGSTAGVILGSTAILLADRISDLAAPAIAGLMPGAASQIPMGLSYIVYAILVVFFIMREPNGLYGRIKRIRLWYHLHPFSY